MNTVCPICGHKKYPGGLWDPNAMRHGWGICRPEDEKPVTAREVREIVREEIVRERERQTRGAA